MPTTDERAEGERENVEAKEILARALFDEWASGIQMGPRDPKPFEEIAPDNIWHRRAAALLSSLSALAPSLEPGPVGKRSLPPLADGYHWGIDGDQIVAISDEGEQDAVLGPVADFTTPAKMKPEDALQMRSDAEMLRDIAERFLPDLTVEDQDRLEVIADKFERAPLSKCGRPECIFCVMDVKPAIRPFTSPPAAPLPDPDVTDQPAVEP